MAMRMISYCRANWQQLLNYYLFLNFLGWTLFQGYRLYAQDRFVYSEVAFLAQNIVLTAVVFLRRPHKVIDRNILHQLIALLAFFSGAAFMGRPATGGGGAMRASEIIMTISSALGIVTILGLGKSFGILIALREVKTSGVYGIIRHPMYFTDILLRIGFVVNHLSGFTIIMAVFSIACYGCRALLEEKFLVHDPVYADYMKRVKYRFLPGVF
jgi:protein-S-isoprenylcysteine O-methyltransferase Ste14